MAKKIDPKVPAANPATKKPKPTKKKSRGK
jgi:hypothetical protein